MNDEAVGKSRKYWKFSGMEFAFWFSGGAYGYLAVLLQSRGVSSMMVGVINAVNLAVAILAGPIWGTVSDKLRSVRKVLLLCLAVGGILYAAVPGVLSLGETLLVAVFILIPVGTFFRSPSFSLQESLVVDRCGAYGLNYGAVRLWGSIGYTLMSVLLGLFLPVLGTESTFYIYPAALIPAAILVLLTEDAGSKKERTALKDMKFSELFTGFYFVVFLLFIVIVNIPTNTAMSFVPYLVEEIGGDTNRLGLIMGLESALEIPVLFLMNRLRKKFPLPVIILGAAVMFTTECFLYSVSGSMAMVIAVSVFHGLGAGMIVGTASNYVYALAPDHLKATAQALYASFNSLSGIVGSLVGGYVIDRFGVRTFYGGTAALILLAAALFAVSFPIAKKFLRKELPAKAGRLNP